MAGLVTKETNRSVEKFLNNVDSAQKREDCEKIIELITDITEVDPKVWGNEQNPDFIIGFGKYTYKRKGGKEEFEWFRMGLAPRKANITLYLSLNLQKEDALLKQLGKCKTGSGCLYINKLADIDIEVLKKMIQKSGATWSK